jgi:hypothetical protein
MKKKIFGGGLLTIGLIVFGFIFLLRSCLAKYDERSSISRTLVFEKDGKTFIFSLVQFDKTVSYSQKGNFVQKSVYVTYYAQTNDAETGTRIKEKKLKSRNAIKSFPVEILGKAKQLVVLFMGELLILDPFTLETTANRSIIENRNPALKGKLPDERKFYQFEEPEATIQFTSVEGISYTLDPVSLMATEQPENKKEGVKNGAGLLNQKLVFNNQVQANYDLIRKQNELYRTQKISEVQYVKETKRLEREIDNLQKAKDSLLHIESVKNDIESENKEIIRRKTSLHNFSNSFQGIKLNSDTFSGNWYGFYTPEELDQLDAEFRPQQYQKDIARNKFYKSTVQLFKNSSGKFKLEVGKNKTVLNESVFLSGGLLLDQSTALPVHLVNPNSFLVVYKQQIGSESQILIARLDLDGKQLWNTETRLVQFSDWVISGGYLIIKGNNNKELGSGSSNLLWSIRLADGTKKGYDFFKNKIVTN